MQNRKSENRETKIIISQQFSGLCSKCTENLSAQTAAAGEQNVHLINDEATLSTITFKDFKIWMQSVIQNTIQGEIKAALDKCTKDIEVLRKDLNESKKEVAKLTTQVTTLKNEVAEITKENKNIKQTGDSNLKYLINADRNLRKYNVMLFGVSETEDLIFTNTNGEETHRASTDDDKVAALLFHLGSDTTEDWGNPAVIQDLSK